VLCGDNEARKLQLLGDIHDNKVGSIVGSETRQCWLRPLSLLHRLRLGQIFDYLAPCGLCLPCPILGIGTLLCGLPYWARHGSTGIDNGDWVDAAVFQIEFMIPTKSGVKLGAAN
jgi:hypothetical protein